MTGATAPPRGGTALRLTAFLGEGDTWHHRPVHAEIVRRARAAGLAGASVFRGVEGFGASALVHTARLLSLSEDLPVAVVIVDEADRVRGFLPQLEPLMDGGLVTLDEVEVLRYPRRDDRDSDGDRDGDGGGSGSGSGGEDAAR
ncbi:DUF190 domain-containing protein [Streptomyces sp. 4N509B]|uniref:DUF190 domain-containing protein n=1 Tax=Streptomyces sp. 4N509B TaxID=3457413 RepID=UPI003FD0616B